MAQDQRVYITLRQNGKSILLSMPSIRKMLLVSRYSWPLNNTGFNCTSPAIHGFLFSLDNKEIYYNKKNDYDIYCYSDKGPAFGGGHDLFIDDNCNKDNENYDNSDHSYNTGKKYALAGSKYFYVEDYEVYQLDLE